MSYDTTGIKIIFDGASGMNIPQRFAEELDHEMIRSGLDQEEYDEIVETLSEGPTEENLTYWDEWDTILHNGLNFDEDGSTWYLYQDGSFYAIREDLWESEEFWEEFSA